MVSYEKWPGCWKTLRLLAVYNLEGLGLLGIGKCSWIARKSRGDDIAD